MRQLPQETSFVDGEGFPQSTVVGNVDGRDKENGEVLSTEISCIRKRSEFRVSPTIASLLTANVLHQSLSEGRRFSGFRIQQFTRGRTWEGPRRKSGRPRGLEGLQLQTCVYMQGGAPLHYTRRPLDPYGPSLGVIRRDDYAVRPVFRVPKESLPRASPEQPHRDPNTLCVNIWEEFIFGKSVIPSHTGETPRCGKAEVREVEEEGIVSFVRRVLSPYLPRFLIDLMIYTAYFLVLFASCIGYNMFCELGCYILFAQHLKIHEKAYEKKLDVVFTGSIFQGPLYAMTRNWCEHCNQRERAKVMTNLMKKMKADILPPPDMANASPQDAERNPP